MIHDSIACPAINMELWFYLTLVVIGIGIIMEIIHYYYRKRD